MEAKNKRDRAVISTLSGCGVSEWIQLAQDWHKYADSIRGNKVPIRAIVTRKKTGISYAVFLWDDAVEDLRELLDERERPLGRQRQVDEPLFANQYGQPLQAHDVQKTVRRLADRSEVEPREKGKVSYRVRPHELGRDYFRTQLALARVADDVGEYPCRTPNRQ